MLTFFFDNWPPRGQEWVMLGKRKGPDIKLQSRQVAWIPLSEIKPLPNNPKGHDIGAIAGAIKRFSFIDPVIVNSRTGHLLSGHGRIEALSWMRSQGQAVPRGVLERDGDWAVPGDIVELDESEEAGAAIALNRTVQLGGWDDAKLGEMLGDLVAGPGLDGVGYDCDDLNALLSDLEPDRSIADETPMCICKDCGDEHRRKL